MGGDYTRFTFKADKNYSEVRQQQGRVTLDADWNEAAAIDDRRWRSETLDILGHCVVPETTPDAFLITPTGVGSFDIGPGRAYLDGLQAENHGAEPEAYDPVLGELQGTAPRPYSDQPYYPTAPALTPSVAGRSDLVYLHVWQREVTALEDPELLEIALGGPDTTTRLQSAWQVQVLEDVGDLHCDDPLGAWDERVRPSAGRLTTSVVAAGDERPCIISPSGGYRGLENRLYRVQIHTPGVVGVAKFKWSRDNVSVRAAVEVIDPVRDRITVRELGRDQVLRFAVGDWVEVLDDRVEFRIRAGEAVSGHTARITAIDEANRILTIDPAIPPALGLDATDPERHTRVQRWDQSAGVDADGLLDTAAGPLELEDGVQVEFAVDVGEPGGEFKRGDYWLFAARTADGSVQELKAAPPRGIHHHYCRLAVIHWGVAPGTSQVHDCRTLWPPARCCTINLRPGEDIQAAIDRLPADGGCVCLLPGVHRIHEPLLIDGRQNILLKGVGPASKLIYEPLNRQIQHQAMLYIVGGSRDIRVAGLLLYADSLPHLLVVDERAEGVHIDGCLLINARVKGPEKGYVCVLLGHCCDVRLSSSRLLAGRDLAQAEEQQLAAIDVELALLRPAVEEENPDDDVVTEPELRRVEPVKQLRVEDNSLLFTDVGVMLQDGLEGKIGGNHFEGIRNGDIEPFVRPDPQPPGVEMVSAFDPELFYRGLDDRLAKLSPCAGPRLPEEEEEEEEDELQRLPNDNLEAVRPRSRGGEKSGLAVGAVLLQAFEIRGNEISAGGGLKLMFSRQVNAHDNRMRVGKSGISLGYAFDAQVADSRIEIGEPDSRLDDPPPADPWKMWESRFDGGRPAIALFFSRGLRVCGNRLHAHTGIATADGFTKRIPEVNRDSLLRVLGIQPLWRVAVEIAWFLYQILRLLSAGAAEDTAVPKQQFEQGLFKLLLKLLSGRWHTAFVGKAEIADNRMQVTRFGVRFHRILSIGGIRVLRNRISGQRRAGIHLHPWYSVGRVDDFANWLRCGLEWLLAALALLRDRLSDFLDGIDSSVPPDTGPLGLVAQGISWVLVLCSRYCGGGEGEGGEEEETPPSPAEGLRDALDEFLEQLDTTWLDDLVNQAYTIDGNVLAGSGDGIVTGLDGSCISNNRITVRPATPVPAETVSFGVVFRHSFEDREFYPESVQSLTEAALEADRDGLFVSTLLAQDWVKQFWDHDAFRGELRAFLGDWALQVNGISPLAPTLQAMLDELNGDNPDPEKVHQGWLALLRTMVWKLRGYGIVMLGADMECRNNRVEAHSGCGRATRMQASPASIETRRFALSTAATVPRVPFRSGALGGIRQTSNFISWVIDAFRVIQGGGEKSDTYQLAVALLAYYVLHIARERSQLVNENQVEAALVHGIRTLNLSGSDETEVMDNLVRNASRYGIYHRTAPFAEIDHRVNIKVHRNSVLHATSAFRNLPGLPQEFAALIWVESGSVEGEKEEKGYGTILLSLNHGNGSGLTGKENAAVHVETTVASVTTNHILSNTGFAFRVLAAQGLFTDNVADQDSDLSPNGMAQGPNVRI